jgi:hypothetical protein
MQYTTATSGTQAQSALITTLPGKHPGELVVRVAGVFGFRIVGTVWKGVLKKFVKASHVFHVIPGIGFSAAVILSPELLFERIIANVEGRGKLETTREYFKAHAIPIHIRRWEPQLVLPFDRWGREKAEEWEQAEARRIRRERDEGEQTELFAA